MSDEVLPPWVIRKNGSYLGAFGFVGKSRTSAVSFHSQRDAESWARANPIARSADVVNDPYVAPEPQGVHTSDYEPQDAA